MIQRTHPGAPLARASLALIVALASGGCILRQNYGARVQNQTDGPVTAELIRSRIFNDLLEDTRWIGAGDTGQIGPNSLPAGARAFVVVRSHDEKTDGLRVWPGTASVEVRRENGKLVVRPVDPGR